MVGLPVSQQALTKEFLRGCLAGRHAMLDEVIRALQTYRETGEWPSDGDELPF